ncbi:unnamed protein product, partial [Musa acuminata subsp. burmannicoides]
FLSSPSQESPVHPWSPSTTFREATGSFPRRRNWLTTSPTGSPAHASLAALSNSPTSTAQSRGIFSSAIGRRAISLRSASPRTVVARAWIERPAAVLGFCTKSKNSSPSSTGARWWWGEGAAFLSRKAKASGRTPGGRCTSMRCVLPTSRNKFSVT